MNRYSQRDDVLRQMGFNTYAEYLRSPLWASIRKRLFKACDRCPCGEKATEAHHLSYKRRYLEGRGRIYKYIVPICRTCHQRIEFDGLGKTPLGQANRVLDQIRDEAEANGIVLPRISRMNPRRKPRKKFRRKSPTSGKTADNQAMSGGSICSTGNRRVEDGIKPVHGAR